MELALVGLGRMGGNMTRRLARGGHLVTAVDPDPAAREALADESGVTAVESVADAVRALSAPRVVWLMLPAGAVTDAVLGEVSELLSEGDLVVDGGNANYHDSLRRADMLKGAGLALVDVGVSGGVWGLTEGYGLMAGGATTDIERLAPVLRTLAPTPDSGWVHAGPVGAGHFTKMVHNGIEYGAMQALAEGFALLQARDDLVTDIPGVAEAWRYGTVIRSWLLDLTASVLENDVTLGDVAPVVADSGEGRWTALEAIDLGVPAPVITAALMQRFSSQGNGDYGNQLLAMMRNSFGGHPVTLVDDSDER
ncbi:MAG TPA: decarboxylating 6-phosphogluconate dehydrogenase [Actinomycetes bacterium]|nr:decarboxylating 6-phosphogluconate dehydrogenase [Actinomycetes bacterium]